MTENKDRINNTVTKKWLIVSWRHVDHLDAAYGHLLDTVEGHYMEAAAEARKYIENYAPVGVVGVIE
jgi:hypothetical protein